MFLILITLLLSLKGNNADAGGTWNKSPCTNGICVNIPAEQLRAEAGLCVLLPCSFSADDGFKVQSIAWYKCINESQKKCHAIFNSSQSLGGDVFKSRVSLLELDLTKNNCSLIINDLQESDSGYYFLTLNAGVQNGKKKEEVTSQSNASVSIKVSSGVAQKPTVEVPVLRLGEQTTLTCTAPDLCSGSDPNITWTWRGAAQNETHITGNKTNTHERSSSLTFTPTAKHNSSEVTCKVNFRGNMSTEITVKLQVTFSLKILNNSSCERSLRSEVVTCVCISEGFPLPTIHWPLLKKHLEYSVITTVSNRSINSTVTLSGKHLSSNSSVGCVSENEFKKVQFDLRVSQTKPNQRDLLKMFLRTVQEPQVIVSFLIGLLLSASICCLAVLCTRKKTKKSTNLYETLEMVTAQTVPLIIAGQRMEDSPSHGAEVTEEHGAEASGTSVAQGDVEAKQVEYSDLDFSAMVMQRAAGTEQNKASTETEYAEIKKQRTEGAQNTGHDTEETTEKEEEEKQQCLQVEDDEASVYSNLEEINDI